MLADVPDACTLPTAARPLRLAEFDALFATALRDQQRLGPQQLRMTLAGPQGLEETVLDLTARESACCSFFDFTVIGDDGTVVLDIGVPEAQTAVLDGLAERARLATARPGR
jgi:hypothetical protein